MMGVGDMIDVQDPEYLRAGAEDADRLRHHLLLLFVHWKSKSASC
jgi:hypothetical protein